MRVSLRIAASLSLMLLPVLSSSADLKKGLAAYDVGDYETSLAECQPLADAGDAEAQFCIGRLYANGFGVAMDDALALHWYQAAAEQGHGESQFNIGVFHANGWGVAMSDTEATKWYRLAANQGFVQAQTTLAKNYHKGRGVEVDLVKAYKWYAIAIQRGDQGSTYNRDEVAAELPPEQLASAEALVQNWFAEHSDVVKE